LVEVSEAARDADIGQPTLKQRSVAEIKKGHLRGGPGRAVDTREVLLCQRIGCDCEGPARLCALGTGLPVNRRCSVEHLGMDLRTGSPAAATAPATIGN
jgi:hypothetical protein